MHNDTQPLKPYDGHALVDASDTMPHLAGVPIDMTKSFHSDGMRISQPYASAEIDNDISNVEITREMFSVARITATVEIYGDVAALQQHLNSAEGIANDFARAAHNACSPRLRPCVYGMNYRIEIDHTAEGASSKSR